MNSNDPQEASENKAMASTPTRRFLRTIGTGILGVGLTLLSYGAVGCWLIKSLPPISLGSGRLPSLYVMGVGIVLTVIGLATRDLRVSRSAGKSEKEIPTSYGVLGLLALSNHLNPLYSYSVMIGELRGRDTQQFSSCPS